VASVPVRFKQKEILAARKMGRAQKMKRGAPFFALSPFFARLISFRLKRTGTLATQVIL